MSKSKTSLLKDNSWIKKADYEDEPVDDDPNFGRTVLNRYKSNETIVSPEGDDVQTTKTITTSTSVQALSKRFGGSQDEFKSSSSLPPSKTTSTKYTYSTVKSDSPITTSKTISTEEQKSSTKTSTVTKNGTTITTTETVSSPVSKTPTKTDIFAERVKSSSKGAQYSSYSPTRTTKVTETTVTSSKDLEDKLYDTLTPTSIRSDFSPVDSKTGISKTETVIVKSSNDTNVEDELYDTLLPTSMKDDFTRSQTSVSSTKTVTVKSSIDGDGVKTTTTTRTSSKSHDPYDTYLPRVTTSSVSSPVSSSVTKREIVTVESSSRGSDKTYSYTRPDSSYEYTSISSPTAYTSSLYRSSSRSDDILSDPIYSKSSIKSVYAAPERTVLEKDLCTSCRKPFTGDAKIVLGDMKINCHATCFKCEVCNSTLGHLKAGDSMWIYKRMVHCENCFEVTRDKWRR